MQPLALRAAACLALAPAIAGAAPAERDLAPLQLRLVWAGEPAGTGDSMDFDLFGDTAAQKEAASDPALADRIETRRTMLQSHQILGLSTLALMTTSAVLGQLNYDDVYGGGGGTGDYLMAHRVSTYASAGAFIATATLSVFAPVPFEKDPGFDTATAHKIAVIGASAGMLAQVGLGFATARSADAGNARNLKRYARIHQAVGYSTVGLMAIATGVWIF
ncbi:MAG TPA: hypothetical protein VN033_02205 [Vulgatibacter sp.]|nr:hypothetical protein [Vulgatibacter sp.]